MTSLVVPESAVASSYYAVAAGERIFRCHQLELGGVDFNPGIGPVGRFTPLISPAGQAIPTLYAAESFDAAVYEVLFRQESSPAGSILANIINGIGVSSIYAHRELSLVSLFTPELRRWNIEERALFSPHLASYSACRTLVAKIWRDNPWADGIVWCSLQDSESNAYLLFGDRCNDGDLQVQQTHKAGPGEGFLQRIARAARRAGISIE